MRIGKMKWVFLLIVNISIVLCLAYTGCSTQTSVLIDRITVMKEPLDHLLPTGQFGTMPEKPVPQSTVVGSPYHPGDRIFIILAVSKNLKDEITLSRFTFYNQETKEEIDLPIPEGLEPFKPGQISDVAFNDSWTVPDEPGNYELRVYAGEQKVISATFAVE
ncbi:MAG: hypothetical protein A2158_02520 [Chloroflexi bacterium RBG_13_46_14]|nr:MAG: hypothetical protein A2158_02520 [Chloroflexi bacterium RBG_13_46_14]